MEPRYRIPTPSAILLTKRLDVSCVVCLNANNPCTTNISHANDGGPWPLGPPHMDPPLKSGSGQVDEINVHGIWYSATVEWFISRHIYNAWVVQIGYAVRRYAAFTHDRLRVARIQVSCIHSYIRKLLVRDTCIRLHVSGVL